MGLRVEVGSVEYSRSERFCICKITINNWFKYFLVAKSALAVTRMLPRFLGEAFKCWPRI